MRDLFTVENKIRIIELRNYDVLKRTDNLNTAFELIRKHQENYPDIEKWFKNKVIPGIKSNERAVYIGYHNDKPVASAVVKKGNIAKFCHLHIEGEFQHQNIGDFFFLLMSIYVRRYAKEVYLTLPEGLWESKRKFFKSYGFQNISKYETQYRCCEEELITSTAFSNLWSKVLGKLPSIVDQFGSDPDSPLNGIVMSIRPQFSEKIMNGDKLIEIRRKFNSKWKNHKVTIYSTSPRKELVGHASIQNIEEDTPDVIWSKLSNKLGCSKYEFDNYTKGARTVYAIYLNNVSKYQSNLSLSYLSSFFDKRIRPPQSYSTVHDNQDWLNIISIAELLHGRLNFFDQVY